jgi:NADH-quinone oxidoreductase subunit K
LKKLIGEEPDYKTDISVCMPINYYIFLSIALFIIGIVGVLTRRNAIIIFMCIELMLNAVNLLLVAFSKMHHLRGVAANADAGTEAQLFVFFIMVVAAAEVSVGLAIIVMLYRNTHSVDVAFLNRLKH